jgi:Arc/MetJ-type ribon-helix-helix transcriptional regulator
MLRHFTLSCCAPWDTLTLVIVNLPPDQKAFVRDAIASGRLHREEDAISEAMALWKRRERARAEILASVDVAEAALARGDGRRGKAARSRTPRGRAVSTANFFDGETRHF